MQPSLPDLPVLPLQVALMVKKRDFNRIVDEVANTPAGINASPAGINPSLYEACSKNLRKGVQAVFPSDAATPTVSVCGPNLSLNVSKFAAYKAYAFTRMLERQKQDYPNEYKQRAAFILTLFNNRQQTEYNAAVARSRTAKQWQEFGEKDNRRLFPNIRWIPSRSVHLRELHIPYYNKVWAKDDPFWNTNQPGALWNCKCDWEETDAAADGVPSDVKPAPGLEGNPGNTGKVFSDNHPYFQKYAKDDKIAELVGKCYYKDNKSSLQISAMAHHAEINQNVNTGRILLDNFKNMELSIRPHLGKQGVKNPEYLINGMIADAKRPEGWAGISDAFTKAKRQKCKAVVIDLCKLQDKEFDISAAAKAIVNRHEDFKNKVIEESYVVWKNKSIIIKSEIFMGYEHNKHRSYVEMVKKILEKLQ